MRPVLPRGSADVQHHRGDHEQEHGEDDCDRGGRVETDEVFEIGLEIEERLRPRRWTEVERLVRVVDPPTVRANTLGGFVVRPQCGHGVDGASSSAAAKRERLIRFIGLQVRPCSRDVGFDVRCET